MASPSGCPVFRAGPGRPGGVSHGPKGMPGGVAMRRGRPEIARKISPSPTGRGTDSPPKVSKLGHQPRPVRALAGAHWVNPWLPRRGCSPGELEWRSLHGHRTPGRVRPSPTEGRCCPLHGTLSPAAVDPDPDRGQSGAARRRDLLGLGRLRPADALLARDRGDRVLDRRAHRDACRATRSATSSSRAGQAAVAAGAGGILHAACRHLHGRALHVSVGIVLRRLVAEDSRAARVLRPDRSSRPDYGCR